MKNQINFKKNAFYIICLNCFIEKQMNFEMLHTSAIHSGGGKQSCRLSLFLELFSSRVPPCFRLSDAPAGSGSREAGRPRTVCSLWASSLRT